MSATCKRSRLELPDTKEVSNLYPDTLQHAQSSMIENMQRESSTKDCHSLSSSRNKPRKYVVPKRKSCDSLKKITWWFSRQQDLPEAQEDSKKSDPGIPAGSHPSTPSRDTSCPLPAVEKTSKTKKRCRRPRKSKQDAATPSTSKKKHASPSIIPATPIHQESHPYPTTPSSATSPGFAVGYRQKKVAKRSGVWEAKKTSSFSAGAQNAALGLQAVKKQEMDSQRPPFIKEEQ